MVKRHVVYALSVAVFSCSADGRMGISFVGTLAPEDDRVAVSRAAFQEHLRGQRFERWADFKRALGPEAALGPEVGGDVRLMSGLSIAFVIILNVLVWAVVAYVASSLGKEAPVTACWAIFAFLTCYAFCVNIICHRAYRDPETRLVTNFLFGAVPLAVSAASYVLALLVLHMARSVTEEPKNILDRLDPWRETFLGRLIFFLAVIPGLCTSIYLGSTVSTGFEASATHIDVLSLCLFIDVGRCAGHASYLVAREWSIGESPTSISSRPGLCYVFFILCIAWYMELARLEAGHTSVILADRTKIHTLACLTTYVFFPLVIYLIVTNIEEFLDYCVFEPSRTAFLRTGLLLFSMAFLGVGMMAVAVVFNAIEPNVLGISAMLWVVFYGAWKLSDGVLLYFIIALIPLSLLAFGAVVVSLSHSESIRGVLMSALAP